MTIFSPDFLRKISLKQFRNIGGILLIIFISAYFATYPLASRLQTIYGQLESPTIKDRNGKIISIEANEKGYYAIFAESLPQEFKSLLIKKEDRFFYYHQGINPLSILRETASFLVTGKLKGSSTISQQLVKILLGNESNRTLWNKLVESVYAIGLELHTPKNEILSMYADIAYFGNQVQGIKEASLFYFNKEPPVLNDNETLSLLAALNNPSGRYPGSSENKKILPYLASILGVGLNAIPQNAIKEGGSKTSFEIDTLDIECRTTCELTIDADLSGTIREILERNLNLPSLANVDNGAIVVIKLPENELLSIVGSPDPNSLTSGRQINMAIRARPIGSTAKPFIYLNAFEQGARPYSLVEDREYSYQIGTGFAFYPKNYDGQYRGTVTLHYALSNSLNVPSVKVLEFVGLEKMYDFLRKTLGFKPIQPLENYELGIALGTLEMDLLTLSHYFTIFPNEGILKPLKIRLDEPEYLTTPMGSENHEEKRVAQKEFVQLINKILSDRETSVEQFGMKSNLTLAYNNYALKTGTSRDYHDSWTIGYTPDFLVGVWLGNSDNSPLRKISGQIGAGKIWHEVMEVILNSPYNKHTSFSSDSIKEFNKSETIEYGLPGDDYDTARLLLKETPLITHPHNEDVFLYEEKTSIPLTSPKNVEWLINNSFIGKGNNVSWHPQQPGQYIITARIDGEEKSVVIQIVKEEN